MFAFDTVVNKKFSLSQSSSSMNGWDLVQDADGLITPLEMHIVTGLFLPMETEAEDNFVEELIAKMDTNVDGKIDYQEFVHFVRNCGTADILSTQTSRSSENNSP